MVGQSTRQIKPEVTAVGIDASLTNTGISILHQATHSISLVQPGKLRGAARLCDIRDRVWQHVIVHGMPQMVAIEGYAYDAVGRVFDLGEGGGVIKLKLFDHNVPTVVVPPTSLKKFATNNGGASKAKMIKAARVQYGVTTKNDNLADAVALAMFAYVVLTKDSTRRCELEAVKRLQETNSKTNKLVFKQFWVAI